MTQGSNYELAQQLADKLQLAGNYTTVAQVYALLAIADALDRPQSEDYWRAAEVLEVHQQRQQFKDAELPELLPGQDGVWQDDDGDRWRWSDGWEVTHSEGQFRRTDIPPSKEYGPYRRVPA